MLNKDIWGAECSGIGDVFLALCPVIMAVALGCE